MRLIDRALLFIQMNLKYDISLPDVASHVGYHPDSFCRYFRRKMQVSFTDYLTGKRLEEAAYRLLETDDTIETIAYDCGFNSPCWFRVRFKQRYQMSPKEFRNSKQ